VGSSIKHPDKNSEKRLKGDVILRGYERKYVPFAASIKQNHSKFTFS
jgi:hypothetical protein